MVLQNPAIIYMHHVLLETQRVIHRLTYSVITFVTQIRQDNQQHILYE